MKITGFKSTIDWYNQNPDQYAKSLIGRERIDQLNEFCSLLPRKAYVLDAGCAGGVNTSYLMNKGLNVVGVDISQPLLEIARKTYPNIQFNEGNFLNLSFNDNIFDGIYAYGAILHFDNIEDVRKTLSEFNRVLKTNGILFLAVKEIKNRKKFGVKKDKLSNHNRYFQYFSQQEIKDLTKELGFDMIKIYQLPESKINLRIKESVRKDDKWIFYFGRKRYFKSWEASRVKFRPKTKLI